MSGHGGGAPDLPPGAEKDALPDPLPERPCESRDLFRDYVGEGREYRGHNGECDNCGAKFSESEDSDLSSAHWMHTLAVERACWERDVPEAVQVLAKMLDPDDPMDATKHAENYLRAKRVTSPAGDDTCWCDGPDCGQSPCVEALGSTRVIPPGEVTR